MEHCLINQSACGRIKGNLVCLKCGMDDWVVYPGQADREAAQTAGLARYWEAHAKGLEQQVRQSEKAKEATQAPPPMQPPPAPLQTPPPQPAKSGGFNWAWVPMVVAMLGVSVYFKFQKEQDQRGIENFKRAIAQANTPSTTDGILNGAAAEAPKAAQETQGESAADAAASAAIAAQGQSLKPEMVRIPAGSFTMGSPESEPDRDSDEGPQRTVRVAAFDLGETEVTFAQWDACVADGGCKHQPMDTTWVRGERPAMNVSWNDITGHFIPWLNRKTGQRYRLPSEAEWEYAARAGCVAAFNVGGYCKSKIEPDEANFDGTQTYNGSSTGTYRQHRTLVRSYKANNWGLYHMHGNVWEWVQDCYEERDGQSQLIDGRAHRATDVSCRSRVLRGGSWFVSPLLLRSAIRNRVSPDYRVNYIGFRLARTVS